MRLTGVVLLPVVTEASVRSENAEVTTIRAIKVATTMSSFRRDFGLIASSFRTRGRPAGGDSCLSLTGEQFLATIRRRSRVSVQFRCS
jgi:hypothetical protein